MIDKSREALARQALPERRFGQREAQDRHRSLHRRAIVAARDQAQGFGLRR